MIDTFRRAFTDFFRHKYLHGICVATIALSVFIISAFGLFLINAGEVMEGWQRGIRVIAYLGDRMPEPERTALMETIRQYPEVAGIDYISGEAAFEWLKKEIGRQSTLLNGLSENPLPDSIEIRLKDGIAGVGVVDALAAKVRALPKIAEVEYAQRWLHRFNGIYRLFKLTGLVLIGMIFTAMMMIVANTVRLILYSRGEEIKITRIIGADESFIKYPLYVEGLLLGFFGGAIGLLMLFGAYTATVPRLSPGGLLMFYQIRFIPADLTAMILMTSMLVGWLGCFFSIRKFLDI